jgi:hypothetical protein
MSWTAINEDRSNLPEPMSYVIVTSTRPLYRGISQISYFDGDRRFWDIEGAYCWDEHVIAWMYLPKPLPTQP